MNREQELSERTLTILDQIERLISELRDELIDDKPEVHEAIRKALDS